MAEIKLKLLNGILNSGVTLDEIENFKNDYENLKGDLTTEYMLDPKKIPRFNKRKTEFLTFIDKYKDLINKFNENNILYDMTGFDLRYHWEDTYKSAIIKALNSDKNNICLLFEKLKENGFSVICFTESNFSKIYYEKIRKKYDKEEYEIEYYESDGQKEYLAQYYGDDYPVIFKGAKIILKYMSGNLFHNTNEAYINSFDIDIESIPFKKDANDIIASVPFDEIKKFTKMCFNLRNIDKSLEQLEKDISELNKLFEYKDLKDIHWTQLEGLNQHVRYFNKIKEDTLNGYHKLGYEKERIEKSVKYLKDAEWRSGIHDSW